HRKEFPDRARQDRRGLAASAASGLGAAELRDPDQAPGRSGRGRDRGQPARAFGEVARGGTHGGTGPRHDGIAGLADARRRDEGRLTMRILHILVIGMLVFAAAYVYRIKMASTVRTERVLKLQADIHAQRDAIAALRAEWNKLDEPERLQGLVERHLQLKPITAAQYDSLKNLPEGPPNYNRAPDPIGAMIGEIQATAEDPNAEAPVTTGSIPAP